MDINIVKRGSNDYPSLLKEIYDPPNILYYKGALSNEKKLRLAVVGARKITPYGKEVLSRILPRVVCSGIEIVSGLAVGVDGEAHRITLENNGITHAVIGSGLDETLLYPKVHMSLARDILKHGGSIISEHDSMVPALPKHFAMRNRIIAGLSHAVLIVEATEKSGSLITADYAINNGREVFAIPGEITKITAQGTNALIKNGAHIVTKSDDILSLFNIDTDSLQNTNAPINNDPILSFLSDGAKHINDIQSALHLTISEVSARLSKLEIIGVIQNIGNMHYIKK